MADTKSFETPAPSKPYLLPAPRSSVFLIGRDSRGNWVARDQAGLCGGLFVDRSEAVRFAMQENGRHGRAVIMVPGILELTANCWPDAPITHRPQERGLAVAAQY
jgi:hypothetical protein